MHLLNKLQEQHAENTIQYNIINASWIIMSNATFAALTRIA